MSKNVLIIELIKVTEVSPSFDTKSVSCGSNNRISLPEIADNKNPLRMQQIQTKKENRDNKFAIKI